MLLSGVGNMRQIIFGIAILFIFFISGVVADESNSSLVTVENPSETQWTISPEASLALAQVYAIDLVMVNDVYAVIYGYESEQNKKRFKEIAEDPNGTIDILLTTLESSTNNNETASADVKDMYAAWDTLNASAYQVISSYKGNNSVPVPADVSAFDEAALNFTRVNDRLISRYIDKNVIDKDVFTQLLYLDLLSGINAQDVYPATVNLADKELYDQKMESFDINAELFASRFPDSSVENLIAMKQNFDENVQAAVFTTTDNSNPEDLTALNQAITDIIVGYYQVSSA